jgi:hypothetical protein
MPDYVHGFAVSSSIAQYPTEMAIKALTKKLKTLKLRFYWETAILLLTDLKEGKTLC